MRKLKAVNKEWFHLENDNRWVDERLQEPSPHEIAEIMTELHKERAREEAAQAVVECGTAWGESVDANMFKGVGPAVSWRTSTNLSGQRCSSKQFVAPHCDERVLHAPGVCSVCDAFPELQRARAMWGIKFTIRRPMGVINECGNKPQP